MVKFLLKILFFAISFSSIMYPELLILKWESGIFKALSPDDTLKYQTKISEILLKYQWPMCTMSDLTPAEIAECMAPGKPYAEEQFVQKKLREAIRFCEPNLKIVLAQSEKFL